MQLSMFLPLVAGSKCVWVVGWDVRGVLDFEG